MCLLTAYSLIPCSYSGTQVRLRSIPLRIHSKSMEHLLFQAMFYLLSNPRQVICHPNIPSPFSLLEFISSPQTEYYSLQVFPQTLSFAENTFPLYIHPITHYPSFKSHLQPFIKKHLLRPLCGCPCIDCRSRGTKVLHRTHRLSHVAWLHITCWVVEED